MVVRAMDLPSFGQRLPLGPREAPPARARGKSPSYPAERVCNLWATPEGVALALGIHE